MGLSSLCHMTTVASFPSAAGLNEECDSLLFSARRKKKKKANNPSGILLALLDSVNFPLELEKMGGLDSSSELM